LVRARRWAPGLGPLVGESPDSGDDFLDGGRGNDPLDGDSGDECVNGELAINCEA
jgi:Ca2+-binding RTX toxin-like protein